jgi:hypothetical protein
MSPPAAGDERGLADEPSALALIRSAADPDQETALGLGDDFALRKGHQNRHTAAAMPGHLSLTALAALELSRASFHEPFHANGRHRSMAVTERSDRAPPQRVGRVGLEPMAGGL